MSTPKSNEEIQAANKAESAENLAWSDRLLASEDFRRFMAGIERDRDAAREAALAVSDTKPPMEYERAARRHDVLNLVCTDLAKKRRTWRQQLGLPAEEAGG